MDKGNKFPLVLR